MKIKTLKFGTIPFETKVILNLNTPTDKDSFIEESNLVLPAGNLEFDFYCKIWIELMSGKITDLSYEGFAVKKIREELKNKKFPQHKDPDCGFEFTPKVFWNDQKALAVLIF